MITDNDRFNAARSMHQQTYLPIDFRRYAAQGTGQVTADYFFGGNILSGKFFQKTELFIFQAGYVSGYGSNSIILKNTRSAWSGTRGPGKGNHVPDVLHAGDKLHQTLEAQTESGMRR